MLPYPNISPDIVRIGPFHLRWYGMMYILGFISAYLLVQRQQRAREIGLTGARVQDLILYLAVGLVAGARLGYILFYQYADLAAYLKHPIEIIAVWHGGMSFHGGLLGAVAAGWLFSRRSDMPFAVIADSVIVTAPVGLFFGRIGNFVNAELYGRVTNVPWGMVFPDAGPLPRHPSQLYEALGEGLLLFIIMWSLRKRRFADGMMVAFFLSFYGFIRFWLEFFRQPDPQIGFILGPLTMGQILCTLMMAAGLLLALWLHRCRPGQPH